MSRIGTIAELDDYASTRIQIDDLDLLAIRRGEDLFLYRNLCPHAADTLDPLGGSVTNEGALLITCQRHAAEFLSDTGECVAGPCQGEFLTPVPFTLSNGDIYLD